MRHLLPTFALALLAIAAPVDAAVFTLDSYSISLRENDPGLVLFEDNLLKTPTSFSLNSVGQTASATLFRIGTKEGALNLDDVVPYDITVGFQFSTPTGFGGTAEGITGAGWLLKSFGYVAWENPLVLSFGSTGLLGITLQNAAFDLPGSAAINATFQLLRNDSGQPTSVPEPASALVFGAGALCLAAIRRRSSRNSLLSA
jgi:hypothetical protein